MNLSRPFIQRPVATTLLTIGVIIAGAVAFSLLPVSPLPQVDFPTVSVSASLPGASPDTMAATVAAPLERSLGRIASVTEMTSQSSLGSTRITLQFDLNRDIDGAARDVQAALNAARALLPTGLPSNPTYRKVNPADAPIMIMALTSHTLSRGQMYDAASTILAQKLLQVKGIGDVTVGGGSLPAVRVELNPTQLDGYGISPETVRTAIAATNPNRPKGDLDDGERRWQILANDQATRARDYLPLIISYNNGNAVRLRDVAEVVDSVVDVRNDGISNGIPAVLLVLFRQPGANIIETVDAVTALLPNLRASIPASVSLDVVMDRTPTIRASLREVERSLLISVALVVLSVFLFLRSGRAALVPLVAVPVSLVGTFAVMYLAGYSLDNLSLMALTIATGFVVDDAVVVLENISRHVEEGIRPLQAALQGAREVGFTVLSMSLSLIAVFIPILLMGGIVGRLFREFAVTLSAAILVSLVVSLTTTPMMCARLLRSRDEEPAHGRFHHAGERLFDSMQSGYRRTLDWALGHGAFMMLVLSLTIALTIYLYVAIPKGFFPQQDTGRITGSIQADQSISFQAMQSKLRDFVAIVQRDPAVDSVVGFTGGGQRNSGTMFISLKPLAVRRIPADQVIARLRGKLAHEAGASLFLQSVQDIRVGGRASGAQYQYTLQADTTGELRVWEPKVRAALARLRNLTDVNTDAQDKGLQTSLNVDRDAIARLGLNQNLVDATLNDLFGQRQVSTIYDPLNQYHVVMEAAPAFWQSPTALSSVHVIAAAGDPVPLSDIASWGTTSTPLVVNHQGQSAASTLSFNLGDGVSLSDATRDIGGAFAKLAAPATIRGTFQGTAKAFQDALANQPLLILAALVAVYLVLGMLYESLVHPVTILSTLPSAGVGALLALLLTGTEFSIIALIGVILLIGIVKKNAIMMIDFALQLERDQQLEPRAAIHRASLLRLRPILMTTVAALFGALPLAIGTGDGAEMRRPLGIAIVGGLILSQLLTLYTTPVIYVYFDRFGIWARRRAGGWRPSGVAASVLIALCCVALTGCFSVGPDYHRPHVETPPAYREAEGWKVAEPNDAAPRGNWWDVYDDPALDKLVRQVEVSNQNVLLAEAHYRQAVALISGARANYFPQITANASSTRSQNALTAEVAGVGAGAGSGGSSQSVAPQTTTSDRVSLSLAWELDLWGRIRRTVESNKASAVASEGDLANALLSAQAMLAQSYLQLRGSDVDLDLYERSIVSYERALKITQNRYDAGVAQRTDVTQAQAQLESTRAAAIELGVNRATLEHAIAVLVGRPPSEVAVERNNALPNVPEIPLTVPATLLERRPDIAAAERRAAAANAQIGVARAAYFPDLTLSGTGGYESQSFANLFNVPHRFWSLGPQLSQTLFDAGAIHAQVRQNIAAYDANVATYRETVLTAFQGVEDNLATLRILAQESTAETAAATAAEETLRITLNQYEAGTVDYLNVVTAQNTALTAERTVRDLATRRLTASVGLLMSLGGGWSTARLDH
ncbi:MAG TPA: multidrug efflux RND transporter permease subunit [Steroidobacteraceae bacterium]|nr:multidrug efflux RND transporter permease subunit [Steroidobacteraceae bacterium]